MEMDDHKRRRNMILYVLIALAVYMVLSQVLFPNHLSIATSNGRSF